MLSVAFSSTSHVIKVLKILIGRSYLLILSFVDKELLAMTTDGEQNVE